MKKLYAVFIVTMLALLGCSLTTEVTRPSLPTPTQSSILTATAQLTATPTQFSTATPTARPTNTPSSVANCTPRTDWAIYVVVSGDTLSTIAQRAGSSVANLTTANCLTNADSIYVGQQLRVPRLPAAPTPTPAPTSMDTTPRILGFYLVTETTPRHLEWYTSNTGWVTLSVSGPRGAYIGYGRLPANGTFDALDLGMDFAPYATFTLTIKDRWGQDVYGPNGLPVTAQVDVEIGDAPLDCPTVTNAGAGDIWVSPVAGLQDRCSTITPNQTIWVTWENVSGLTSAEYYFLPTVQSNCGTPGQPNVIGTDRNMADGNMITWYIGPGPCAGILYAFGYTDSTMVESRQHALVVYSR